LVDIPSVFNKPDFLGILLPGYIGVMLAVALFLPELAPVKQSQGLSLDFFSAVVFLVAGPALGYTLRQLHRTFYTVLSIPKAKREPRKQGIDQYYALRIAMTDSEKKRARPIRRTI
jgi:DNA-binding FadR family transcriptional regulator